MNLRKMSLLVGAFLMSLSAVAMPKVGDTRTVSVKVDGVETYTVTALITAEDTQNGLVTIKTTMQAPNQPAQEEEEAYYAASLPTEAAIDDLLATCAEKGGALEKVTTTAGAFDTCTFTGEKAKTSYGKVPFAMVKSEGTTEDGKAVSVELVSFAFGK